MSKQNKKLLEQVNDLGVKVVAFDIDGTLYPNYQMYLCALKPFFFHPKIQLAFGRVRSKIRKIDTEGKSFRLAQAELLAVEMLISIEEADEIIEKHLYKTWIKSFRKIRAFKNLRPFIQSLSDAGYKIYAMSDFPVENKLSYLGVADLFDGQFTSEDTGRLKPDAEPFDALVKMAGVEAKDILYFGNSYSKDVIGSRTAGMKTAYITRKKKANETADIVFKSYTA